MDILQQVVDGQILAMLGEEFVEILLRGFHATLFLDLRQLFVDRVENVGDVFGDLFPLRLVAHHSSLGVDDRLEIGEDPVVAAVFGQVLHGGDEVFSLLQPIPEDLEEDAGHVGMPDDIVGLADELFGRITRNLGEIVVGVGDDPFGIGIALDVDVVLEFDLFVFRFRAFHRLSFLRVHRCNLFSSKSDIHHMSRYLIRPKPLLRSSW